MSQTRSRKTSKAKTSSHRHSRLKEPLREAQNKQLAPIYDKVAILRRELENKHAQPNTLLSKQINKAQAKQHFLELPVDRNMDIEKKKKQYQSQKQFDSLNSLTTLGQFPSKESKQSGDRKKMANTASSTSLNWREANRNKTKSLINFLQNNKSVPDKLRIQTSRPCPSPELSSFIQKNVQNQELFQPVGQQYFKQKMYQESLKSETVSVTSKQESSIRLQKIGSSPSRQQSKRYLRKGTRVRQILSRQLKTPDDRTSSHSSMTYLKEYDQWVPSTMVEEKREELQAFMNIIYGEKKVKGAGKVDLNKMELIYL